VYLPPYKFIIALLQLVEYVLSHFLSDGFELYLERRYFAKVHYLNIFPIFLQEAVVAYDTSSVPVSSDASAADPPSSDRLQSLPSSLDKGESVCEHAPLDVKVLFGYLSQFKLEIVFRIN
jgi:hypothetical protein